MTLALVILMIAGCVRAPPAPTFEEILAQNGLEFGSEVTQAREVDGWIVRAGLRNVGSAPIMVYCGDPELGWLHNDTFIPTDSAGCAPGAPLERGASQLTRMHVGGPYGRVPPDPLGEHVEIGVWVRWEDETGQSRDAFSSWKLDWPTRTSDLPLREPLDLSLESHVDGGVIHLEAKVMNQREYGIALVGEGCAAPVRFWVEYVPGGPTQSSEATPIDCVGPIELGPGMTRTFNATHVDDGRWTLATAYVLLECSICDSALKVHARIER